MIKYNFKLHRFQDAAGRIRSNISGLLSSTARKTLDPYRVKKETYKEVLDRLQTGHKLGKKFTEKKPKSKSTKVYEPGEQDDWKNDYNFVSTEELESAIYGYNPVEGADIFRRVKGRRKHRTPGKFMYNTPQELKRKYTDIILYTQLQDTKTKQVWLLPLDFSFSLPLSVKEIYERIQYRSTPRTKNEINAAKRRGRTKNLSIIERINRFILPAINTQSDLQGRGFTHWKLTKIVAFKDGLTR